VTETTRQTALRSLREEAAMLRERIAAAERGDLARLMELSILKEQDDGKAARVQLQRVEAAILELEGREA